MSGLTKDDILAIVDARIATLNRIADKLDPDAMPTMNEHQAVQWAKVDLDVLKVEITGERWVAKDGTYMLGNRPYRAGDGRAA